MKAKFSTSLIITLLLISCERQPEFSRDELKQEYYGNLANPTRIYSVMIAFGDATPFMVEYETYDSLDIIDGDMIIRDYHDTPKSLLGNIILGKTWPDKTLPYVIPDNLPQKT